MILAEPVVLQRRVVDEDSFAAHEVRPRVRTLFATATASPTLPTAVRTLPKGSARLGDSRSPP
jgi:hypothetical protein